MIALGGIIGAGIFVASGTPIRLAGPGVVVSYLLGGIIVGLVMNILGEMSAAEPSTGSFSHYANKYLGSTMGFVTGWMYWSSGIFSMATEVTAASLLSQWWFPHVPLWIFSLFFSVLITMINFLDLKGFGKAESWLSSVKVFALALFILIGVMAISGISFKTGGINTTGLQQGGIFPRGWFGIYSSMLLVIFAYAGMQNMTIAAANVNNPKRVIPRAIIFSIVLVTILYTGSIAVIVGLIPWQSIDPTTSPFVSVFDRLGITFVGGILNFVVLSAILSSMNTTMFGTTRMLHSLSSRKEAPRIFLKSSPGGVPIYSLVISSIFLGLVILLSYFLPKRLFIYVSSSSSFITLFNWTIIIITYLAFKKINEKSKANGTRNIYYFKPVLALALVLLVISSVPFVPQQIPGMIAGLALLTIFLGVYFLYYRKTVNT